MIIYYIMVVTFCYNSFHIELLWYLSVETAIAVTVIYTAAGLFMFLINRKWKFIFLPLLYAIFGAISGIIHGFILCMECGLDML